MNAPDLYYIIEALRPLAVPITALVPDPENARKHGPDNLRAIRASLQEHGQYLPLIVQKEGMIVRVGNGRLSQMKELGWTHAAAIVAPLERLDAVKIALADNRTSDLAEWDYTQLKTLIAEFDPSEFSSMWDDRELKMFLDQSFTPPAIEGLPTPDDVGGPNNLDELVPVKFKKRVHDVLVRRADEAGFKTVAAFVEAALVEGQDA